MSKKILSTDDIELFRHSIGKVRPVNNDKVLLLNQEKPKPRPKPKPRAVNVEDDLIGTDSNDIEKLTSEDTLSFTAPGLQKSVLKKLRKGQYGMDAEIDLHGLNSREAKRQLLNFLRSSIMNGCRCVHIVHGKGYRSSSDYPILKNNLNVWLRQHKNVQAFCSAPARSGGAGAVYVLLQLS